MPNHHDLIVVGGSAGAQEALSTFLGALPRDLPAAVCVVVHVPAYLPSRLPELLDRIGPLRVVAARDGMPLRRGVVHVAPPDLHMLVDRAETDDPDVVGTLRLARGPKENRARPAIDPLFRSAAVLAGPRVIAIVLSGALDDGTAGLWSVRDRGGVAVAQDPADALITSMPATAISEVGVDHIASAADLGALVTRLVHTPVVDGAGDGTIADPVRQSSDELRREVAIAAVDENAHQQTARYGVPSRFSCPDCGGVLWDLEGDGGPLRFRCETGHAYSQSTLAEMQTENVEAALWAALRAFEDKVEFGRRRADDATRRGLVALAEQFTVEADATQTHAAALRAILRLDGRAGRRAHVALELTPEP